MQLSEGIAAASFATVEAMEDKVDQGTPLVVVFGPSYASANGLKEVRSLTRRRPEVASIMVVEELTTQMLQQALRAGVRDVVAAPADAGQLIEAVERAAETLTVVPSAPVEAEGTGQKGRLISVFSTKGGAGKSVVASNLAIVLSRQTDRPVVLVDADLQFGDVAVMMKLTPQHTIVDAVAAIHRLDAQLLQSLLVRHEPSGLYVLPAPAKFAYHVGVHGARNEQRSRPFCDFGDGRGRHLRDVLRGWLASRDAPERTYGERNCCSAPNRGDQPDALSAG